MSLLLNNNIKFDAHTFGNTNHPDCKIATKISNKNNFEHSLINLGFSAKSSLFDEVVKYTTDSLVNNVASSILQLQNYMPFANSNRLIIDGGFGEIWRREFFYKLYLKGKSELLKGNLIKVIPYLSLDRPEIFNIEIKNAMFAGISNQLDEIFSRLPRINLQNFENWLDLFAIKTRLPNFYSHEQTRLDQYVTSFMPFAQLSLLNNLWAIPAQIRRNGRLFKKLIYHNYPSLSRFSLAKGEFEHPYFLNSLQSRIWNILAKKYHSKTDQNGIKHQFLNHFKEFIFDMLNTKSLRENTFYDIPQINKIASQYYQEHNLTLANEVDWFLSFELFRQELSKKNN